MTYGAVLAPGVHSLEHDQERVRALSVQPLVQLLQPFEVELNRFLAVTLTNVVARRVRIEGGKFKAGPWIDRERGRVTHSGTPRVQTHDPNPGERAAAEVIER
jgi:hypothetical protein